MSRSDVLEVHRRGTASATATFVDPIGTRGPFPVRAIQVEVGSEFQARFEAWCRRRRIRLFLLSLPSPKLYGSVERAQRTHTEEFYEAWDLDCTVTAFNHMLRGWEEIYNSWRLHQSLGYRTPHQYLRELAHAGKG